MAPTSHSGTSGCFYPYSRLLPYRNFPPIWHSPATKSYLRRPTCRGSPEANYAPILPMSPTTPWNSSFESSQWVRPSVCRQRDAVRTVSSYKTSWDSRSWDRSFGSCQHLYNMQRNGITTFLYYCTASHIASCNPRARWGNKTKETIMRRGNKWFCSGLQRQHYIHQIRQL